MSTLGYGRCRSRRARLSLDVCLAVGRRDLQADPESGRRGRSSRQASPAASPKVAADDTLRTTGRVSAPARFLRDLRYWVITQYWPDQSAQITKLQSPM